MLIQAPMKHGRQQVHVADGKSDMDCCACLASTEPAPARTSSCSDDDTHVCARSRTSRCPPTLTSKHVPSGATDHSNPGHRLHIFALPSHQL